MSPQQMTGAQALVESLEHAGAEMLFLKKKIPGGGGIFFATEGSFNLALKRANCPARGPSRYNSFPPP